MQLKQKDRLLDGLRTELEELRGPLPLNYAADGADDNMSLASEVQTKLFVSVFFCLPVFVCLFAFAGPTEFVSLSVCLSS